MKNKTYKKRQYRKWTDDEVIELRNGIIPAGRNHANCWMKAKSLGFQFIKAPGGPRVNSWTEAEEALLRQNKAPSGRTMQACRSHAFSMGIKFHPLHMVPTEAELELIRQGKLPDGWKMSHARYVALQHGWSFRPAQLQLRETSDRESENMYVLHAVGNTYEYIGKLFGVTRERVRQRIANYTAAHSAQEAR